MKNVKHEFEQEIQIKEKEMINLTEQNKLELKNIEQIKEVSVNDKSIKEIFFYYLFSLLFSVCTSSSFSTCYREKKIISNQGEEVEIKINQNKNVSSKNKKLLRNDLKFKPKS